MAETAESELETLCQKLGHSFAEPGLLAQALTHPSVENEGHYERLEFMGDRVLGFIVSDLLYARFAEADEGELAARLTALVRGETLAEVAREAGIDENLRTGAGLEGGARATPHMLADACEAVIAALYLDGGIAAARGFIERFWSGRLEQVPGVPKDAKTTVQEWALARGLALPAYRVVEREGPDHDLMFTVEVALDGGAAARGSGGTKKAAEQAAAAALLGILGEDAGD